MARATVVVRSEPEMAWWRPLVAGLLSLPHAAWNLVQTIAVVPVALAIGVSVLATGRVPGRLAAFQVTVLRERVRFYTLLFALRSSSPPLATTVSATDPGDDPGTTVSVDVPATLPRWSLVTRPFVALPHVLALLPIGVVMDLCYPLWMAVAAVFLYVLLATDEAPRFGLAAYGHDLPGGAVAAP